MYTKNLPAALCIIVMSCQQGSSFPGSTGNERTIPTENTNPYHTVDAIPAPPTFERLVVDNSSFAGWLRKQRLKRDKTVYLYNGAEKKNQQAQFAVLNVSVGKKDLQQCADAAMRLRAECFFENKHYYAIAFTDNAGTAYQFAPPYTQEHFQRYLDKVFGMCGSASLSKQLHKKILMIYNREMYS